MKNFLSLFVALFMSVALGADVKISELPLGSGVSTGLTDSFPYVSKQTGVTKRLTLYDIANIPALTLKFAPLASPTFTGTVTAPFFSGTFSGNAATATALAANPTDCTAGYFANVIDAGGNLTCGQVGFSLLTGSIAGSQIPAGTIDNSKVSASAAIDYSKLNLVGAVTNADLAGSIADTKLATISTAGKVSNSATTATSANTNSAIVTRDASGNFSAGTITANLLGTATNLTGTVAIANGGTGQITATAGFDALAPTQTGNSGKYLSTNGSTTAWTSVDALPTQTGNSGKYLTTNGTIANWALIDSFPTQTGNAGKYLTTNGTAVNWADIPPGTTSQGQDEASAVTTTKVQAPYSQVTTTASTERLIETGNDNILVNASFEGSTAGSGWTLGSGVSVAAETTHIAKGKKSAKLTLVSTNGVALYQDVTPTIQTQSQNLEYGAWVKTSLTTVQVCARQAAAVVGTCTNVLGDNIWHYYPINYPGVTSGSIGVGVRTTSSSSGDVYVDSGYVGLARNLGVFSNPNTYAAKVTTGPSYAVTSISSWLTATSSGGTGQALFTFASGTFTTTPACECSTSLGAASYCAASTTSPNSVLVFTYNSSNALASETNVSLSCNKVGADAVQTAVQMNQIRMPTITRFTTAGAATYTVPAGVTHIKVAMVGGGGGGSGTGAGSGGGGGGGPTTFAGMTANGGGPGAVDSNGGTGGTATCGAIVDCSPTFGGDGEGSSQVSQNRGGGGAPSALGGGGRSGSGGASAAGAGRANTGGGGGGGGSVASSSGAGGGSGAYIEAYIKNLSPTYAVSVGVGGTAGAGTYAGGAGGTGVIEITEYYGLNVPIVIGGVRSIDATNYMVTINTIVSKSADYTPTSEDETILMSAGTFNLPAAATMKGKKYELIQTGTTPIIADPAGSETICGQTTIRTSGVRDSIIVQSDGGSWHGLNGSCSRSVSAYVTAGGVVSEATGADFISGNCGISGSNTTCTFNSGTFSSAYCSATQANTPSSGDTATCGMPTSSAAGFSQDCTSPGIGNVVKALNVTCWGHR